ncbi:MAG: hypothetical protein CL669_01450 [Balneola sp.]|nr:hypothetical protein [Balneola sp.]
MKIEKKMHMASVQLFAQLPVWYMRDILSVRTAFKNGTELTQDALFAILIIVDWQGAEVILQ